jgi:hypothetical protein
MYAASLAMMITTVPSMSAVIAHMAPAGGVIGWD